MLDVQSVYEIAKRENAEITERRQIQWHVTENSPGRWIKMAGWNPSVLDAVILDRSWHVYPYLAAAKAATMWTNVRIMGFLQGMLLGRPLESGQMKMEEFQYWKGMLDALMVIQKLKSRQVEAEKLFQ